MTSTTGFNADDRAAQRDAEPVTIGGKQFTRARLNNKAMRELRAIGRESDKVRRQSAAAERDLEKLHQADEPDEKKIGQTEKVADGLQDDLLKLSYRTIQLQLGGAENGPALSLLEEHLDMRDAEALSAFLAGEDAEDPTSQTASTSS